MLGASVQQLLLNELSTGYLLSVYSRLFKVLKMFLFFLKDSANNFSRGINMPPRYLIDLPFRFNFIYEALLYFRYTNLFRNRQEYSQPSVSHSSKNQRYTGGGQVGKLTFFFYFFSGLLDRDNLYINLKVALTSGEYFLLMS